MMRESFLRFVYEAAGMQRWNDHIRPHKGFTELDKQAHKMFFAYIIGIFEEEENQQVNWTNLIEGAIFEFFHRVLLTDIKPPIFHKLMEKHGNQLNHLVIEKLREKGIFELDEGIEERLKSYLFDEQYSRNEKRILKASHYLATKWEFDIVYRLSSGFFGLEETKKRIDDEIEDHYDVAGVKKLILDKKARDFLNLVGQLRFQQRWAQTPRTPETSVAGHMFIVALLSYMMSLEVGACEKRKYNNFFAGLFHDMPEVLTRDIISPVKNSVEGLGDLIKEIEENQMEEIIFPLLPFHTQKEVKYFTENEFKNRVMLNNTEKIVEHELINSEYNFDQYSPIDGSIIEFCDKLSAYIEAYLSIKQGISTDCLKDGHKQIYESFRNKKIAGINAGSLFDYFKL